MTTGAFFARLYDLILLLESERSRVGNTAVFQAYVRLEVSARVSWF